MLIEKHNQDKPILALVRPRSPNSARGDRGKGREIPDKMIVDPRDSIATVWLQNDSEDDEEGGAGTTRKDAGRTS